MSQKSSVHLPIIIERNLILHPDKRIFFTCLFGGVTSIRLQFEACRTGSKSCSLYMSLRRKGISPLILNLGTRYRWVMNFMPPTFFPRYVSNKKLGGPQSRAGTLWEEKSLLPLTNIQTLDLPICNIFTIRAQVSVVECFVKVFVMGDV